MAIAIDENLFTQDLRMKVAKVLDDSKKAGTRVSGWEAIQKLLLDSKAAWYAQVPPEFVGVHPLNRSRLGVGGSEAHRHGMQILQAGWSWAKCSDATAIEVAPSPHDSDAKLSNEKLVSLSGGFIPPLVQMKLLSVGGGHTNSFLRACKAGCKSAVPKLADESGHLNLDQLSVGRQSFRDACTLGMRWFVMHWACAFVWPELMHFAQASLNTTPKNILSEIEVMLDIHGMVKAAVDSNVDVDWKRAQEAACFSLPPCTPYVSKLIDYVKEHAGGPDGELLHDISAFYKAFACSDAGATRNMGSEFIDKLAHINFGKANKFPHVVAACFEANLISPPNKVVDGICKLISASNIASLTSKNNRKAVEEAEQLMQDARSLCERFNVEQGVRTRLVGRCDTRCVLIILNKLTDVEKTSISSIAGVAEAFVKELSKDAGVTIDMASLKMKVPTGDLPTAAASSTSSCWKPQTVEQMRSKTFQAEQLGFKIGAYVVKKSDKVQSVYQIDSISDDAGVAVKCDTMVIADMNIDELLSDWRVHKGKVAEAVELPNKILPHFNEPWGVDIMKGLIGAALRSVFASNVKSLTMIEVQKNPQAVIATKDVKARAIFLVAATGKVTQTAGTGVPIGSHTVAEGSKPGMWYVHPHIVPEFSKTGEPNKSPFMSPFWHVKTVEKEKEANMTLEWVEVDTFDTTINVPVLTNKKAIAIGDELTWCKKTMHIPDAKRQRRS